MNWKEIFRDIKTGFLLFLLTSYILFTIPPILSDMGMPLSQAFTSVALSVALSTLLLAMIGKVPGVMGPGIAISAFLVYNLHNTLGLSFPSVMALSFLVGLSLLALTLSGLRDELAKSFPGSLRYAILAGIGLYMVFLGLSRVDIISYQHSVLFDFTDKKTMIVVFTLFSAIILFNANVPWSFLLSIFLGTLLAIAFGFPLPSVENEIQLPNIGIDFNTLKGPNILSAFISIFLIVFFDTLGVGTSLTFFTKKSLNDIFRADAISTMLSAFIGAPPSILYIESTASLVEKAKSSLPGVVASLLFLLSIPFSSVLLSVPLFVSSTITIVIGIILFSLIKFERYEDPTEYVPAILTVALIPATMSISQGISFGILSYVFLKIFTGRSREISPILYILSILILLDSFKILYI